MERVSKSITVQAPLRAVYNQWTQFEEFPQFMEGIRSVQQLDDTTLRWTAEIAGKEVSWTAKVTEQVPDQLIAWQSTSGRTTNGRVHFGSQGASQTQIHVEMEYDPEGMVENIGDALGMVGRRVEGDLERFKDFIEQRGQETGGWRGEVHQGQETGGSRGMNSRAGMSAAGGSAAMGSSRAAAAASSGNATGMNAGGSTRTSGSGTQTDLDDEAGGNRGPSSY